MAELLKWVRAQEELYNKRGSWSKAATFQDVRLKIEELGVLATRDNGSGIRKAKCFDCGIPYPFGLDLVLPDNQWNYIFPEGKGEGGGLLCPSCIAKRASKNPDSTVILAWIDRIDWAVPYPQVQPTSTADTAPAEEDGLDADGYHIHDRSFP